ncbi:MAG: ferredoxin [Desulfobacteraceae bacterium]|nr:ferredoxin [Desulfobacteraceae bacterium]
MVVDIDYECCLGCAACAELCPDIFEMDYRIGKAHVIVFEVEAGGCAEEAAAICPVSCISITPDGQ